MNVIGATLGDLLEFDGQTRTLPLILKNCLDALRDDEGILNSVTLFRGSESSLPELAKAEEEYQSPNRNVNMLKYDADTTSALLLRWLSRLPEPLITPSKMSKFEKSLLKYGEDEPKLIRKFTHTVKSLPAANCNSLNYLLVFLRDVLSHSSLNGLSVDALAKIFGTSLGDQYHPNRGAKLHPSASSTTETSTSGTASSVESADTANSDASAATNEAEKIVKSPRRQPQHCERVVAILLQEFPTIFADLTIEDTETIPEEQLVPEARDAKAKRKHMIRSNSGSIEKPMIRSEANYRKTMVVSSSAENLPSGHHHSHSNPTSSPVPSHLAHSPAPSPSSPSLHPNSTPNNSMSPTKPDSRSKSPSKTRPTAGDEETPEKEKEKKGFMGTLRKLGFGKSKDKSPARSRSNSTSHSPTPQARAGGHIASPAQSPGSPQTDPLPPNAVFGMPFEKLLVVENASSDASGETQKDRIYPFILVDGLEYLKDASRAKEFGVFRESGSFNDKMEFKRAYDAPNVRINFEQCDGYTVAALLKEWLRALPECLLTDALYYDFKASVADGAEPEETNEMMKAAIAKMPETRRNALHYLIHFFKEHIVAHQADNKMTDSNVGIVIGPCLHRKENASPEELMDPCHNLIVTTLLQRYEVIFSDWQLLEPLADPPGTIWKKGAELDKAPSVIDDINRKMAQEGSNNSLHNSGSQSNVANNSNANTNNNNNGEVSEPSTPDRNASPDPSTKKKRKGSGIWDRLKEEAGGGRKRSATTQSETAPFQEQRTKVTRSPSSNGKTIETASPQPKSGSSTESGQSETGSAPASPAPENTSPKASPRDTKRKGSSSNLMVITRPLPPVSDSGEEGLVSPSSTSGTTAAAPLISPTASIETPVFTKKRSKKLNRVRELSTGSSTSSDLHPAVALLTAAQVEAWLIESNFSDLSSQLKNTTGKQLHAFTRADLKEEFGLRGVALYNHLHPASESNEDTNNASAVTLAILSTQISLLTTKMDELLVKLGSAPIGSPMRSPRTGIVNTSSSASPTPDYANADAAVSAALYPEPSKLQSSDAEVVLATFDSPLPSAPSTQPIEMFGEAPIAPEHSSSTTSESSPIPVEDVSSAASQALLPSHEAPPVPSPEPSPEMQSFQTSSVELPTDISVPAATNASGELKGQSGYKGEVLTFPDQEDYSDSVSAPQIGVIEATPRSSRATLLQDIPSYSSSSSANSTPRAAADN